MTDDEGVRSELELRDAVNKGWHRLEKSVLAGAAERRAGAAEKKEVLRPLAALTGIPFRQLDMVRRVRNEIAHPDHPVPRDRLQAALRIIEEAERRLVPPEPMPGRSGRSTSRTGDGRAVGIPSGHRLTLRKPDRLERSAKHMDVGHVVERTPQDSYMPLGYRRLALRRPDPRRAFPGSQGG